MAQPSTGWQMGGVSSEAEFDQFLETGEDVQIPNEIPEPEVPGEDTPEPVVVKVNTPEEFTEEFGEPEEQTEVAKPLTIDQVFLKAKAEEKAQMYGLELDEDTEWTDEAYMQFETELDDYRLELKYGELKKVTPEIEALLELAENGGDINSLLSIFDARKELKEIDTSKSEGKIELIRKFYKDVKGESPEWIDKYVRRLQVSDDDSDINEEFASAKTKYDEHFAKQTADKVAQAETIRIQKETKIQQQQDKFVTALKGLNYKDEEISKTSAFVYNDKAFENKQTKETFSAFDVAIIKAKNDPQLLADLVLFLSDKPKYDKKVSIAKVNEVSNSKFRKTADLASGAVPGKTDKPTTEKPTGFKFNIPKTI